MGFGSIYKPSVLLFYLFLSVQPTGFMCCDWCFDEWLSDQFVPSQQVPARTPSLSSGLMGDMHVMGLYVSLCLSPPGHLSQ